MSDKLEVAKFRCKNPDCTVLQTGICLEGHKNYLVECSNIVIEDQSDIRSAEEESKQADSLDSSLMTRRFWSGLELGLKEIYEISRSSYSRVVGVVGTTGVGKTCFLNSIYLILSSNYPAFENTYFMGSKTLSGFEDRAKYMRKWQDGKIPEVMSERTTLTDPRMPGFLHLELLVNQPPTYKPHNVFFTDLPGEWFERLITDVSSAERLMFLKRADVIILTLDGEKLLNPGTRHYEFQSGRILIGRLKETLEVPLYVPILVMISKADVLGKKVEQFFNIPGIKDFVEYIVKLGFNTSLLCSASFSRYPEEIASGYGIPNIMEFVLGTNSITSEYNGALPYKYENKRFFSQYTSARTGSISRGMK